MLTLYLHSLESNVLVSSLSTMLRMVQSPMLVLTLQQLRMERLQPSNCKRPGSSLQIRLLSRPKYRP